LVVLLIFHLTTTLLLLLLSIGGLFGMYLCVTGESCCNVISAGGQRMSSADSSCQWIVSDS